MKFKKSVISLAAIAAILSGCGTYESRKYVYKNSDTETKSVAEKKEEIHSGDTAVGEAVREIDGVWLGRRTIKVSREAELPVIFSQNISFQFPDRPTLTVVGDRLSKITGIPVRVAPDALVPIEVFTQIQMAAHGGSDKAERSSLPGVPGTPVQNMPSQSGPLKNIPSMGSITPGMNVDLNRPFILDMSSPYTGTLRDLLDQLSARYGVGWDYKDGLILISRMVTRTYQIASLIDTNETSTSVSKTGGSSTEGGGGAFGGLTQSGGSSSTSDVSSRIQSRVDVVEGLKESLTATLTPNVGKFSISSFGVITVTDTREVQDQVRELIDAENRAIGRQVRLRMVTVEVEASTKNDLGFDWTWAITQASRKWNVDFTSPAGMVGGSVNAGQLGVIRNGSNSKTSAFFKALAEVGRVTLKRDETYTLMNNRSLSVSQIDNFIYPARSTPAYGNSVSGDTTTSAGVEPGQLTTGDFLNLRASVQPNGSVIVMFSLDSSRKGTVETYESNGSTLQYPQSSGGNYQTYASIPSGQTGVIAVIDAATGEANDRSYDAAVSPLFGGGYYTNVSSKKTLILLTPYVIEGAS